MWCSLRNQGRSSEAWLVARVFWDPNLGASSVSAGKGSVQRASHTRLPTPLVRVRRDVLSCDVPRTVESIAKATRLCFYSFICFFSLPEELLRTCRVEVRGKTSGRKTNRRCLHFAFADSFNEAEEKEGCLLPCSEKCAGVKKYKLT